MAVRWKKGAAPMVVPGIRVVIEISCFNVRVEICGFDPKYEFLEGVAMRTLDSPGEGLASVLMIRVSFSDWKGLTARSYDIPLLLTGCRIGSDHIPLAPPIACSLRLVRTGRSR